jgi:hypothetical protein
MMNRHALNLMRIRVSTLVYSRGLGGSERRGPLHWRKALAPGSAARNCGAALLVLIAVVGSGCSGVNASKSVSPLDLILPGLLHKPPPLPMNPDVAPELTPTGAGLPVAQIQPPHSL